MEPSYALADMLTAVATQPVPLVVTILIATFLLEDVAVVTVALLASQMLLDPGIAIAALLAGTILGDVVLYVAARWFGSFGPIARLLAQPLVQSALAWISRNALPIVILARFAPGFRLPVYLAAGAVRMPIKPFLAAVIGTALLWTPLLFVISSKLGMQGVGRFGGLGWGIAIGVVVLIAASPALLRRWLRPAAALPTDAAS
ncbi:MULTISPECIES: DedA family protein [unclassified Sphingomonas]|uniref:DedA family protein n=1 Tax=unclassified Sphingomonas TaxID=196159 RepID=UPI000B0ECEC6|nr:MULTISPECIES: DedA family protein [unclassified Sphingomonas]MCH4894858.1 hypothetical protein [Sphingomonas sp. SFZ2018-12]